jgi:hypothetical protein
MLAHRSARPRAGLAVAVLVLLATSVGLVSGRGTAPLPAAAAPVPVRLPDTLALEARYAGLGGEGADLIWRGRAAGVAPGLVTIRIEYAGPPAERSMPAWPVNAWFCFSSGDPRSAFAAELSGSVNWRTGEVRATGLVSNGARAGTPLELRMHLESAGWNARVATAFLSSLAPGAGGARVHAAR